MRMFDWIMYLVALYNLAIVKWGEGELLYVSALVCFCVCLIQLLRMARFYYMKGGATLFNKADMVVISDEIVPLGTVAKGRLDGVYYMHSGRKEV